MRIQSRLGNAIFAIKLPVETTIQGYFYFYLSFCHIYIMLNDFADLGASYLAGRLKMKCGMTLDSGILSKLVLRSFGLRAGTTFF